MEGPEPRQPLRGRYSSKSMQELFPVDVATDYRYLCSPEMRDVFSDDTKFQGWRNLWYVLAQKQHDLGLPISFDQLVALGTMAKRPIDYERANRYERELKHDVNAHKKVFGEDCSAIDPTAQNIIHWGATSMYVCDNEEITSLREALKLITGKVQKIAHATETSYLTPVIDELVYRIQSLKARGAKGTTGTQASYLQMFDGDHDKVTTLDRMVSQEIGFQESYTITGQTYPRIVDYQVLGTVAVAARALEELMNEYDREMFQEHFQGIYASAKEAAQMAAEQWHERSLDDSAERRIIQSEALYRLDFLLEQVCENPSILDESNTRPRHMDDKEKQALTMILGDIASAVVKMHTFAQKYKDTVCTAYTHGQFAQPTTYGKRLDMWAYNFVLALNDIDNLIEQSPHMPALDLLVNTRLNQVAIAASKLAVDIRLLQRDFEVYEPFGIKQIGSSAMFFKKNPMRSERGNGLARHKVFSTYERRLSADDWLTTDAMMRIVLTIFSDDTPFQKGFTVNERMARENVDRFMPYLAGENIKMQAIKAGGDEQTIHKVMRDLAMEVREQVEQGGENDLLERMARTGLFEIDLKDKARYLNPEDYVGRSREQVKEFGTKEVDPIRKKYAALLGKEGGVEI